METGGAGILFVHAVWGNKMDYFTLAMCCYLAIMFTQPGHDIYARAPAKCARDERGALLADVYSTPRLAATAANPPEPEPAAAAPPAPAAPTAEAPPPPEEAAAPAS